MAKLKAVIVGAGFIATKKHIPAFLKQKSRVELVALCDLNQSAAEQIARQFGIRTVYRDSIEMLSKEKPDIVDICTPPQTHVAVAVEAMRQGCHVLIEKPMALSVSECDEILNVSRQHDVKVCVGHSDLFYPPFMRARELVARGVIGKFRGLRIFLSTPTDYMTSRKDHWAHRLPGGVIGETGPHAVYMTLAFMNPIRTVKVHGLKCLPYAWSSFEDYRLDLVGDQAVSTVTSVYTTNQWAAQVDIWGDHGMLKLDLELMSLIRYCRNSLASWSLAASAFADAARLIKDTFWTGLQVELGRFRNTHDILLERFIDSIEHDTESPVTAEEGLEAVRVMSLIVEQLETQGNGDLASRVLTT